jgi:cytochrome P450
MPDPPVQVTVEQLAGDPHPVLRRLRETTPVAWVPALGGWLVTRHDLAERVLRDAAAFTVDDPRFTTARVVGQSMLSTDGDPHRRHREPFARALRRGDVTGPLAAFCAAEADRLVAGLGRDPDGRAELRRGLAGPLAVAVVGRVLGLTATGRLLAWYDAIVAGVSALTEAGPDAAVPDAAGTAFAALRASLADAAGTSPLGAASAGLSTDEFVSNAAVLLFGGIETTEGMISNAVLHLLSHPAALAEVRADRSRLGAAVDESVRLEPAAAVVDRYATAAARLGGAVIRAGDLVIVSLAGANRDPAVFPDPDRFDPGRPNTRRNLSFALGPHFCIGAQLARRETEAALAALLDHLPGLRLAAPAAPAGLVFRQPPELHVRWDQAG